MQREDTEGQACREEYRTYRTDWEAGSHAKTQAHTRQASRPAGKHNIRKQTRNIKEDGLKGTDACKQTSKQVLRMQQGRHKKTDSHAGRHTRR